MRFINLFVVSIFLIIGITSCGGVKNDPVEISNAAIKYIKKGDFIGMQKLLWKDAPTSAYSILQEAYDNPAGSNYKIAENAKRLVEAEYTLSNQRIDGDNAQIIFRKITPSFESSIQFYLKRVDGKWYLQGFN